MKQLTREEAKDILKQLSPEELAIYKELNTEVGGLNEADVNAAVQNIKSNWKSWSTAMLMAIMMNANMSAAIKNSAPDVYNAINTEISTDTTTVKTAPTSIPGSVKSISFNESFASGKATLTNKDSLVNSINELKTWMKGKKMTNFKIVITASESQVTNPKGFEKKGSLAQARAKEIENIVSKLGFDKIDVQTKVGTTPYKKGNDINDPKYTAEQFVTVNIVVDNDICGMKPVSTNSGQGEKSKNYITFEEYLSGKGTLEMSTGTIPDRVVILDANGNIKQDTGYITTKEKDGEWQYTPEYVLALTKAYMDGSVAMKGIDTKLIIKVTDKYDLIAKLKKATVGTPSLQGSEVGPAMAEMEGMIKKGINQFVIYNVGISNVKLNFDDSKGDVQVKLYSPVGKTGYSIAASCNR